MTNVLKFFEKKNVKIAVMALNLALIVGLVIYIFYMHSGGLHKSGSAPSVTSETYTEEELALAMSQAEETMVSIYGNLIPGSKAEFSDGNTMNFSVGGNYSGYFDEENPSVNGTYIVTASDDDNYLADVNIYNGSTSNYVQYKLMYDENKDFVLYYPANGALIPLKY